MSIDGNQYQYEKNITMKLWAEEDRPREKLMVSGRRVLTDAELIVNSFLVYSFLLTEN